MKYFFLLYILGIVLAVTMCTAPGDEQIDAYSPDETVCIDPPDYSGQTVTSGTELLFIQVVERNGTFDSSSSTSFHLFNPSQPDNGSEIVFKGPGQHQYCRMVTFLYNGWGIATGSISRDEDDSSRRLFWFNPLSGKEGNTICNNAYLEHHFRKYIFFFAKENSYRYDMKNGQLITISIPFLNQFYLPDNRLLAETSINDTPQVVILDLLTLKISSIFDIPEYLLPQKPSRPFLKREIRPAGNDGFYFVQGFSVWFFPAKRKPSLVIKDVKIIKTFGGFAPHLPVAYIGNGKFAVAKSIRRVVDTTRRSTHEAISVTLLIDGHTGKVLDSTDHVTYSGNPPLTFRDEWKSEVDNQPSPAGNYFEWDDSSKTVVIKGWKQFRTHEKDRFELSGSGRYLVSYRQWNSEWGDRVKYLKFTIFDGLERKVIPLTLNTECNTMFVNTLFWLTVTGEDEFDKVNDRFVSPSIHPFMDPLGTR